MKLSLSSLLFVFLLVFLSVQQSAAQMSDSLYEALKNGVMRPEDQHQLTHKERIRLIRGLDGALINNYGKEVAAIAASGKYILDTTSNPVLKVKYAAALGTSAMYYNDYGTAIVYYRKATEYPGYIDTCNDEITGAYAQLAAMYTTRMQYDSSLFYLQLAQDTKKEKDKDSIFMCRLISVYELLYENVGLYERSIEYSKKYNETLPAMFKWGGEYVQTILVIAQKYNSLFRETGEKKYADSSLVMIGSVLEKQKEKAKIWYGPCYYFLGQLKYYSNQYKEAIPYYDSCLLPKYTSNDLGFPKVPAKCKLERAICLLKLGHKEAVKILDTIQFKDRSFFLFQARARALYEYEAGNQNWKKALQYYNEYRAFADSIDVIKTRGRIFEVNQKFSVAEKEKEVARKEIEIKSLENKNLTEKDARTKMGILAGAVVVALLLLVMALYTNNKRLQAKRLQEQQQLLDNLQNLEQEMEEAQLRQQLEKEAAVDSQRKTISKDMHDGISSGLAALKYYVEDLKKSASEPETKTALYNVQQETEVLYAQAREYMHQLNQKTTGAMVINYNIVNLLRTLAERFDDTLILHIKTSLDEQEINRQFSAQQHYEMYMVIKEAVANIIKHAQATETYITVNVDDGKCSFSITDNGRGFDVTKAKTRGMGLESMAERIRKLKGTFSISSKHTGTVLSGSFGLA